MARHAAQPDTAEQHAAVRPVSRRTDPRGCSVHVPTVFLPGLGLDSRMWDVSAACDVRTLDFPGIGSAPFRDGMSLDDLADFVAAQLEEPSDVVGFSLGSYVAQHLVLRHPTLVRSLVLACGPASDTAERSLERADELRKAHAAGQVPEPSMRWPWGLPGADSPAALRHAAERSLRVPANVLAAYWEALAGHNVFSQLCHLLVPTTVIAADDDSTVPAGSMVELAKAIPNSRLLIGRGSHFFPLENWDEFNAIVDDHLAWVRTGASRESCPAEECQR